jgi:hypothetical protein
MVHVVPNKCQLDMYQVVILSVGECKQMRILESSNTTEIWKVEEDMIPENEMKFELRIKAVTHWFREIR